MLQLTKQEKAMIAKAKKIHGNITTCHNRTWKDSFTINKGYLVLWFNTVDNGTHILKEKKTN